MYKPSTHLIAFEMHLGHQSGKATESCSSYSIVPNKTTTNTVSSLPSVREHHKAISFRATFDIVSPCCEL